MTRIQLRKTLAVSLLVIAGINFDRFLIGEGDPLFDMRWTVLFIAGCSLAVGISLMKPRARA